MNGKLRTTYLRKSLCVMISPLPPTMCILDWLCPCKGTKVKSALVCMSGRAMKGLKSSDLNKPNFCTNLANGLVWKKMLNITKIKTKERPCNYFFSFQFLNQCLDISRNNLRFDTMPQTCISVAKRSKKKSFIFWYCDDRLQCISLDLQRSAGWLCYL